MDRPTSKAKAAGLMATMTLLGTSLGMMGAKADDMAAPAPSKSGASASERLVQQDSKQLKYWKNQGETQSNQYKEITDSASPKLDSSPGATPEATHALNPQPLPPGEALNPQPLPPGHKSQ